MEGDYDFTVDWFTPHWSNWLTITKDENISKILEIGSFEGRSTCATVHEFSQRGPLEVYCIDSWAGGAEHDAINMNEVERRFDRNIEMAIKAASNPVKIYKYKGSSDQQLVTLLYEGHRETFDLVFVDGSHRAPDVLSDLVQAYQLCAVGGLIICDDYLWDADPSGPGNPMNTPRPAIDAFVGIYTRKVQQFGGLPIYQIYLRKTA